MEEGHVLSENRKNLFFKQPEEQMHGVSRMKATWPGTRAALGAELGRPLHRLEFLCSNTLEKV